MGEEAERLLGGGGGGEKEVEKEEKLGEALEDAGEE